MAISVHPAAVALSILLSLTGCALTTAPESAELARDNLSNLVLSPNWEAPSTPGPVQDNWVAALGDHRLDALVVEGLAHNADLRIAATRMEQAAAIVKAAGGQLLPSVDLLARGGGKLGGDNSGLNGWLLSASWELDLWGRVRYERRAAEDQYAAVESDVRAAAQSVVAMVAKSWFLAIEARQQHGLATEMVATSSRLVNLAEERQQIGPGTALDVARARAANQTFRDAERGLALAESQAVRSLELLLGRYPKAELDAPTDFLELPTPPGAGLPSELLERRPDVVAAQRRVNTAFSRVGEAEAARLPRLTLTASASSVNSDLFVLQDRDDPVFSGGATLLAPLFRGGALKAQADARRAEQSGAEAVWARTGLTAFGEVEGALATEVALREREPLLLAAARENDTALHLESERYRVGNRDLRTVLQQEMTLYASRSALLRAQAEQRVNRVNLHLALGGGFDSAVTSD